MTRVVYEPGVPALCFSGHAGAGPRGGDPVCAALSMLMYTLLATARPARRRMGSGFCRAEGGDPAPYAYTAAGVRLLAQAYPGHVRLEVRP